MKSFLSAGLYRLLTGVFCVGAVLVTGQAYAQSSATIKVASYFAEEHPQNVAIREKFKPYVENHSDMKVKIYPNSSLGDERQYTNGVRTGSIEMAIAGMGLQTADPRIGFPEWPFLFENYDQAQSMLNGPVGEKIDPAFRELGVEPLAWTANGFRVFSSNRRIGSMEDFKGFKLRMPNLKLYVRVGQALGANVQTMGMSEVYPALEQGVVDGQDNPLATLYRSGWYEVQSNVLESRHMFSPNVYLMNKRFYDNLSEEDQKVIQEASHQAMEMEWQLMRDSAAEIKQKLKAAGLEVTEPDQQFHDRMVSAMQPIYDDFEQQYDWAGEWLDMVRNHTRD
ncbi:tripartite ATP-independent transporter DctP family solute receptor [Kushneria sinocarnis]|uniref:Tripartite ATP-independent transporter DctP family solute receptor n=1 Tax=Kushneria sinocarnis TaxID=595502 RepID=A0A420X1U8_9GAMM|nr:TRAP transporter substrate-binding protein [Kushneria sinocarnis]RKR07645.1 tripartite ATP-independent transporter DctP family solute receptor [Kushneria sinocarnis]